MRDRVGRPGRRDSAEGGRGRRADQVGIGVGVSGTMTEIPPAIGFGGPAMMTYQHLPGGLDALPPVPSSAAVRPVTSAACTGQDRDRRSRAARSRRARPRRRGSPACPPAREQSPGGAVIRHEGRRSATSLTAGPHAFPVTAQPDPVRLRPRAATQAGKPDPAVPDRDVELEADAAADRRRGGQAGEVPEVDAGALFEADQAVMQPSAQVRQTEQPRARSRVRGLDPGQQRITGPEGSRSGPSASAAEKWRAATSGACSAAHRAEAGFRQNCHHPRQAPRMPFPVAGD